MHLPKWLLTAAKLLRGRVPRVFVSEAFDKNIMATPKPKRDPRAVFATAEQFRMATNCLLQIAQQTPDLRLEMPGITLAAVGLELYLKCLAIMDGKQAREDSHHLWKLFTYLNGATQNKIRQRAEPRLQANMVKFRDEHGNEFALTDFDKILKLSSGAIRTARYPYEGIPSGAGWAAGSILIAAREVILEMKPEWDGTTLEYPKGLSAPAIGPA
jgi:hypothetical protein